jgi:hypothetical protein
MWCGRVDAGLSANRRFAKGIHQKISNFIAELIMTLNNQSSFLAIQSMVD